MTKKLCKSKSNKMICGVCSGVAEYFAVDPTVVRMVWALVTAFAGAGIVAYIAAAIIMPNEDDVEDDVVETSYREDTFDE